MKAERKAEKKRELTPRLSVNGQMKPRQELAKYKAKFGELS